MKLCLLFYGQVRTFDHPIVIESWNKFFKKYDCTNYMCVWDKVGRSAYSKLANINDNLDENKEVEEERVKNIFNTNYVELYNYDIWKNNLSEAERQFEYNPHFNSTFAASFLRSKITKYIKSGFDAYLIVRPDLYWINDIPEHYFNNLTDIYHQNSSNYFYPNRVYNMLLFSNEENIRLLTTLYESNLFYDSIYQNFGCDLDSLDICKVMYSYLHLTNKINLLKTTDLLYADVFRDIVDVKNYDIYRPNK